MSSAEALEHPVYRRLTESAQAFTRHAVLHELGQRLRAVPSGDPLVRRARHCLGRGVPYFAPADAHYRDWAAQVAALWAALDARAQRAGGSQP